MPQDRLLPDEVDGFAVIGRLGQGDFATTYHVRSGQDELALKIAHDGSASARQRMHIEAKALSVLRHKAIPRRAKVNVWENRPYIAMQLAKGRTVQDWMTERSARGLAYGDIEALQLLVGLLDVLAYMHGRGWVHRDVKSANVMTTSSSTSLTLLDYGFAKGEGEHEIRLSDSFFRAGAARYSPPTKLRNPGEAAGVHDVFAAGVLTYQLLTNTYPWTVEETEDVGRLAALMTRPPRAIRELNSLVHEDVAALVLSLLETDDAHRPDAASAAKSAAALLRTLTRMAPSARGQHAGRIPFPHVTRDPLYGDVRLTDFELEVLDHPELQRLRRIKQLGLTNLVYVGAEHSRLSHSVGCVHRVEQILRSIEDVEGVTIEPKTRLAGRLYALVHDVGHVAYGHTVEDELNIFVSHEANGDRNRRIVVESSLGELLRQDEAGQEIVAHFDIDASIHARSAIKDLVEGSTGADVLDYIDRDSLHCGLHHRVDSALFRGFRLWRSGGTREEHLVSFLRGKGGPRIDREYAVESLLNERYALYLKVYTHPAKIAASVILGKGILSLLHARADALSEEQYEKLSDPEVLQLLLASDDQVARTAGKRLKCRQLPAPVFRARLVDTRSDVGTTPLEKYGSRLAALRDGGFFDPAQRLELERQLAATARVSDAGAVMIYCPPRAPGYQLVEHWLARQERVANPVRDAYPVITRKHLELWEVWLFTTSERADERARLSGAMAELMGLENQIELDRRTQQSLP